MNELRQIVEAFEKQVREKLPELAPGLCGGIPDGYGNYNLLELPWPTNPTQRKLGMFYRPDDCFEVAFHVLEARGPAERQFDIKDDLSRALLETVNFLKDIVRGGIVVDVRRWHLLSFKPHYQASFRESNRSPSWGTVETLRWMKAENLQNTSEQ